MSNNVYLIKGDSDFEIQKLIEEIKIKYEKTGLTTKYPTKEENIEDYFYGSPFFGNNLVIFAEHDLKKLDEKKVKEWKKEFEKIPNILVFKTSSEKTALDFIKNKIEIFLPAPYKMEEYASKFCDKILKLTNLKYSDKYIRYIVTKANYDISSIYYEIQKLKFLAEYHSSDKIFPNYLKESIVSSEAIDLSKFVDFVYRRSTDNVIYSLYKIKEKEDIYRVVEFLSRSVLNQIKNISAYGAYKDDEEVAKKLNTNKWFYQNKIKPTLTFWTIPELSSLLANLLEVKINILKGCSNSWIYLNTVIIEALTRNGK